MKSQLTETTEQDIALLEKFILNNSDLERLEAITDKFNIFLALDIIKEEVRHSNFLAWLLDPNGTHGAGDYFLKNFLKKIAANNRSSLSGLSIFDINLWELDGVEVKKEWQGIDIFLVDHNNNFLCVIENKVDSSEHDEQLTRYRTTVEEYYPTYKKLYIYLTIAGERPEKEQVYLSVSYATLSELVEGFYENRKSQLNDDVSLFISHYLEMLNRYIMENSEVQKICQQIYLKHQRAIELINLYKPDLLGTIVDVVAELLNDYPQVIIDHRSATSLKFTLQGVDFIPKLGEGWTRSKRIMLFELQYNAKGAFLALMLGPGNGDIRKQLYHAVMKNPPKGSTNQLYGKWTTVYKCELQNSRELKGKERPAIKSAIQQELSKCFSNDLPPIVTNLKTLEQEAFVSLQ
jgi:hypothetical protein